MQPDKKIPDIIIGRLPIYLRALENMAAQGTQVTSSHELGKYVGISAAQIRKDVSQFGEFGKQGTGYNVQFLIERLRTILRIDKVWDVAVIGIGDIGHAISRYSGFINRGFRVSMIFDSDTGKIGKQVGEFTVLDIAALEENIQSAGIQIAMISTPSQFAQEIADKLVKAGVKAILNYAPINLSVPENIYVEYIDPATHLQRMTYYLSH